MKFQQLAIRFVRLKIWVLAIFSKKKAGETAFRIFCTPPTKFRYDEELLKDATKISLKFKHLNTCGYQWNKGGTKRILITHGFRSSAVNFRHFAKRLAAKNYEVIAFDAPAHGLSEGKTLNALEYKEFIDSINSAYGPFDGYLTHSYGGMAVSLSLSEMEKNGSVKLVMIAPAGNSKSLCQNFFDELRITDPLVQNYFFAIGERLSGKSIEWFSIGRCVPMIQGPVLWIHDEGDRITPVDDAKLVAQKSLPNYRFIFTKYLGHRRIYRDEKVIKAAVDFL